MPEIKGIVAIIEDWGSVASALEASGAYILDVADRAELESVFDHIDGLVLTGGEDINPVKYRATPARESHSWGYNQRDIFEYWAVREARRRRIPILGICRGHQMLNVAHGGTLHQHVPNLLSSKSHGSSHHDVLLRRESRLSQAIGMEILDGVMSLHHQAVDRLGHGLVPVGWSKDGIIEAIESAPGARPYVLGTQFHPEIDWSDVSWSYADLLFRHWMEVVSRHSNRRTLNKRMNTTLRSSKDYKDTQRRFSTVATGYSSGGHWEDDPMMPGVSSWVQEPKDPDDEGAYESWLERNAYSQEIAGDWDEWGDDGPGLRNTRSHRRDMLSEDDGHNIEVMTPSDCDDICGFPPCASPYDCSSFGDCAAQAVANTKARAAAQIIETRLATGTIGDAQAAFQEAMDVMKNYDKEGRPIEDAPSL